MTLDPNLSVVDECQNAPSKTNIYVEQNSGDKGVHNPGVPFWISPDIAINPGTSFDGIAATNKPNDLAVRPHVSPGCTVPGANPRVRINLYVCTPSMSPFQPGSTYARLIRSDDVPAANVDVNGLTTTGDHFDHFTAAGPWTPAPANPADPDDPQNPGHRCLIARCYPTGTNPDTTDFHIPDDPHSCQRNMELQVVNNLKGTGADGEGIADPHNMNKRSKMWEFGVLVANVELEPAQAELHVDWAGKPPAALMREIKRGFSKAGVKTGQIGAQPPKFGIRPKDLPRGFETGQPSRERASFTAVGQLAPREERRVHLQFDLAHLKRGELAIFHAYHMSRGRMLGGITWALRMA
jgi:hypothetical protein